jgi:hypothetical protein
MGVNVKNGVQVLRPLAPEQLNREHELIPSLQQDESPTRFPIFTQDISPLIPRTTSPSEPILNLTERPTSPDCQPPPAAINLPVIITPVIVPELQPVIPELINPLDRPSSPEPSEDPFVDPEPATANDELESIPLSRTTSHTLSFHSGDDENSMSDWTEAFDNQSDSDGPIDIDSDSDIVSDAESEASWARVRSSSSRGVGYN